MSETELMNLKCPVCHKPLANDEYHYAMGELKNQIKKTLDKEYEENKKQFEEQIDSLKDKHLDEIKEIKQIHEDKITKLKQEFNESNKQQLDLLKEQYDEMTKNAEKQYEEFKKQSEESHKKEIGEKEKQLKELKEMQDIIQKQAEENAKLSFENQLKRKDADLQEREIQIKRLTQKVEELGKQLNQTQSELKGELGELNLYETLTSAFPEDSFKRQTRGQESGDIIQTIRTNNGILATQIIYDNKEDTTVTLKDIEKAKKYQNIHNTSFVLIVSSKIPKTYAKNGIYGIKDGIPIVHPSILVEVATRCRGQIMDIARISKSKKDREAKESKLFDYIMGREFTSLLSSIYQANEKLRKLQEDEQKKHHKWWKDRQKYRDQLLKAYMEISTGVESITQKESEIKTVKVQPKKLH